MTIPCDILVFGGTGDLALHKLLPALYHLYREARLNNAVRIIALARRNISRNEYLKLAERHCRAQIARNDFDEDVWQRFAARLGGPVVTHTVASAGHLVDLDQPAELARQINAFLVDQRY